MVGLCRYALRALCTLLHHRMDGRVPQIKLRLTKKSSGNKSKFSLSDPDTREHLWHVPSYCRKTNRVPWRKYELGILTWKNLIFRRRMCLNYRSGRVASILNLNRTLATGWTLLEQSVWMWCWSRWWTSQAAGSAQGNDTESSSCWVLPLVL